MERILSSNVPKLLGKQVSVGGWVAARRDHGKLVFLDLRDKDGIVQVVVTPKAKEAYEKVQEVRPEWVLQVTGMVQERPEDMKNKEIPTGEVEIAAEGIRVLASAQTPPFPLDSDGYEIEEDLRLKYRYLDLRRQRLQRNIKMRSAYLKAVRDYLLSQEFVEIETPLLTKSTPEGSRDFVVPSRLYPGKFFALPQSPQQYKQLLMAAGFERYFQIAKALRDEDPRADRAYEHTQIDMEMSFVEQEDVRRMIEEMTIRAVEAVGGRVAKKPFPVFTYEEAIKQFGADKFDPRSEQEKKDVLMGFAWVVDFPFFEKDKEGKWTFTHNPFSAPLSEEHEQWLLEGKNIEKIQTKQYDLVCNGFEVSSGSVRSHKPEVLRAVFRVMGYSDERIDQEFGHMLEAFSYGTPPHGGCAQGFERILMAYLQESSLREVQAFPQTGQGRTSVMDAPSELSAEQLQELRLRVTE